MAAGDESGDVAIAAAPEPSDAAATLLDTSLVTATLAEAGCLAYSYAEDVSDPGLIRVSELWESRAHLAAHFGAPHMAAWQAERTALGMTGRQITAYELGASETL